MLLLEEPKPGGGVTRVIMTGDGHPDDVLAGLTHHGLLADGAGTPCRRAEDPAPRLGAQSRPRLRQAHHRRPLRLLRQWRAREPRPAESSRCCSNSRLGTPDKLSPNPEAGQPFTIWLNCSTNYLEKNQAAYIAKNGEPSAKLTKCIKQFKAIEEMLANAKQASNGRLRLKYLKASPLELAV